MEIQEASERSAKASRRIELIKDQLISNQKTQNISRGNEDHIWKGFSKITIVERQHHLKSIYPELELTSLSSGGLELIRADSMIENCIGVITLPVGLALNFLVNSKKYTIPMAVEEPSIIAAASSIGKLVSNYGGFFSTFTANPMMIAQIHIVEANSQVLISFLESQEDKIIHEASKYCEKMIKRGGGPKYSRVRILKADPEIAVVVLDIYVDTCDSMGANLINTIAEGVSSYLQPIIPTGRILMKILSNLSIERIVHTEFKIPITELSYKGISGIEVAKRIIQAYEVACLDVFRTATHNKGVMNGIDAVAIALGQDWRAIEAGAHTFSSLKFSKDSKSFENDRYKPFTYYKLIEIEGEMHLYGSIRLPMALGVIGGAINSNPNYMNFYRILGFPNSSELAFIMSSVGLANNFAALRALVCTGIQKGHMALHARNVAIRAGVPDKLLSDVVEFMKQSGTITEETAKEYLLSHHLYKEIRSISATNINTIGSFSNFYIEVYSKKSNEPIIINIILSTPPGMNSINFKFATNDKDEKDLRSKEIFKVLFGTTKSTEWFNEILELLSEINITNHQNSLITKVQLIEIIQMVICYNLLDFDYNATKSFLQLILNGSSNKIVENKVPTHSYELNFGLRLILEMYEIIKYYQKSFGKVSLQSSHMITEIKSTFEAYIDLFTIEQNRENFNIFIEKRKKKLCCKLLVLTELEFADENIDSSLINQYYGFAEYHELKSILARDFAKKDEGSKVNSYIYYEKCFENTAYFEFFSEQLSKYQSLFIANKAMSLAAKKMNAILVRNYLKEKIEHSF